MTAPTPTQIAEWFKQGSATFLKDKHAATFNTPDYFYASGYLRARTEQATEIAALKAQIAELMPLAKFCATLINDGYFEADDALYAGLMDGDYKFKPEIKATIDKLLKDQHAIHNH